MTRVNQKMNPQQAVPPETWEHLGDEEKSKRQSKGLAYAFTEFFVYAGHALLPEYSVPIKGKSDVKTNFYLVDFRTVSRITCDSVVNPKQAPIEAKCLELSIETRSLLREKIAAYFARIPAEDIVAAD